MSYTLLDNRDKDLINQDINKISEQYNIKNKFGSSIVVNDSADFSLMNLKLYGKTTQTTTSGKNLLKNEAISQTIEGITYTVNADKSVTANGTATGDSVFAINDKMSGWTLKPQKYNLSGCPSSGGTGGKYRLQYWGNATGAVQDVGSGAILDLTGADTSYNVSIVIPSGTTMNNATFYPMIRLASIADPTYEPFSGGQPSPSPQYQQPLESVGEWGNLFGGDVLANKIVELVTDATKDENAKTVTYNAAYVDDVVYYDKFEENKQYTIILVGNGSYPNMEVAYTDGSSTGGLVFTDGKIVYTTVVGKSVKSLNGYWSSGSTTLNYDECGIFEGVKTLADYRPYSGQKEIESGVYGGNLLPLEDTEITYNGLNVKVKDGIVTLNGTTTDYSWIVLGKKYLHKGTYTSRCENQQLGDFVFYIFNIEEKEIALRKDVAYIQEIEANTYQFVLGIESGKTLNVSFKPKLNYGTEELPWTPYTKQSHISLVGDGLKGIPLGQTIPDVIKNSPIHMDGVYWDVETEQYYIGDTVENESVERTVRIKSDVWDGSQLYEKNDANSDNYLYYVQTTGEDLKLPNEFNAPFVMSDKLIFKTIDEINADNSIDSMGIGLGTANVIYLNIGYLMTENTDAEVKRVLTENPITVQYILAEPYTVPLTASEIASYKALHSNYKVTSVMNDCDAEMEIKYAGDAYTSGLSDVINKSIDNKVGNIDSKVLVNGAEYGIDRIQIEKTDGQLQLVFRAADGTRKGAINFDLTDTTTE